MTSKPLPDRLDLTDEALDRALRAWFDFSAPVEVPDEIADREGMRAAISAALDEQRQGREEDR